MMKRFFCIVLLIFSVASTAKQQKSISWIMVDFAPYYIFNDRYESQGRDESVIKLLKSVMPDYHFNYEFYPSSRAIQELSNPSKNYCMLSLYKSEEREKHIRFTTVPSTIGLSPAIAIHKELVSKLGLSNDEPISLNSLINEYQLTLGVSMNRSYGNTIDTLINTSPDAKIIVRPGRDTLASLTYMLYKRRIDILLGYPSEHYYLAHSLNFKNDLMQLQLLEAPDVSKGYIGCTRDATDSEAIINYLNDALVKINQTKQYQDTLKRWLPDDMKGKLDKYIVVTND